MDKTQESVLIGTMLGDGGLRYKGRNCRLHIKHAAWQLPLVQFKHEAFRSFVSMKIREFTQVVKGKRYSFAEFVSRINPDFTIFYNIFYRDGKKIVPKNIETLLTEPLSLAVWFMDDGTLDFREKDHCAFHLCTNCFSKREAEILTSVLLKNFGVIASVHYTLCRGKRHSRVYIGAQGRDRFIELISPYILSCFQYKLPKFRHTPQRLDPQGSDGSFLTFITR